MADADESHSDNSGTGARHAGWAALLAVLAVALVLVGGMLVAMLQAPVYRPRIVVTGFILIAAGLALLPVAWIGRHPRR